MDGLSKILASECEMIHLGDEFYLRIAKEAGFETFLDPYGDNQEPDNENSVALVEYFDIIRIGYSGFKTFKSEMCYIQSSGYIDMLLDDEGKVFQYAIHSDGFITIKKINELIQKVELFISILNREGMKLDIEL